MICLDTLSLFSWQVADLVVGHFDVFIKSMSTLCLTNNHDLDMLKAVFGWNTRTWRYLHLSPNTQDPVALKSYTRCAWSWAVTGDIAPAVSWEGAWAREDGAPDGLKTLPTPCCVLLAFPGRNSQSLIPNHTRIYPQSQISEWCMAGNILSPRVEAALSPIDSLVVVYSPRPTLDSWIEMFLFRLDNDVIQPIALLCD